MQAIGYRARRETIELISEALRKTRKKMIGDQCFKYNNK